MPALKVVRSLTGAFGRVSKQVRPPLEVQTFLFTALISKSAYWLNEAYGDKSAPSIPTCPQLHNNTQVHSLTNSRNSGVQPEPAQEEMPPDTGGRLHFTLPPGIERFSRFKELPYDIRHKIWEQLIYTPGIHFLKFERNDFRSLWLVEDLDSDEDAVSESENSLLPSSQNTRTPESINATSAPSKRYSATLVPVFPMPAADLSYHIAKNKTLTQLSLSCNEAANEVSRITSRPGNLRLDNGRLISLANSSDVVCIDYPDIFLARGLGPWAKNLNTAQLSNIRRLAVRYLPEWDAQRRLCRYCGRYHELLSGSRKEQAPRRHLYQFAALFPQLETFYFLDHLIVRQPSGVVAEEDPRWLGPSDRARLMAKYAASEDQGKFDEPIRSGTGRVYYEVDRKNCGECKVHSNVFKTLEWVRENYIELCEKKPQVKHKDPRSVKFAILACEWNEEKLVADQVQQPEATQNQPRKQKRHMTKKQRRFISRSSAGLTQAMSALNLEEHAPNTPPVVFGGNGNFVYEFSFRSNISLPQV